MLLLADSWPRLQRRCQRKSGAIRNWDYRFCWLRDTTFSLQGLLECGFENEARAWLGWLNRSILGDPSQLKIMYGITGKREHTEWQADWLPGYARSAPVHIGNKASSQLQLDTYGEMLDSIYRSRHHGMYPNEDKTGAAIEGPSTRTSGKNLAFAGRRVMGVPQRPTSIYALEGNGVGGL